MSTPIETQINAAWTQAFQSTNANGQNNPNYIPNILNSSANTSLSPVNNVPDSSNQINICYIPFDEYSPIPTGNANLSCSNMTASGFANATGGTPAYSSSDSLVALPISVSQLVITGNYSLDQGCCTPTMFKCFSDPDATSSGTFTLTISNVTFTLSCSIETGTTASIVVNSVNSTYGSASASINNGSPSWLNDLLGIFTGPIANAVQNDVSNLLSSSQLLTQMQNAVNVLLGSSASAAMSRERLTEIARTSGLPEGAVPYGPVKIEGEGGSVVYRQRFRVSDGALSSRAYRLVVQNGDTSAEPKVELSPLSAE